MSIYPRTCEECGRTYTNKNTFSQHKSLRTCERTVAKLNANITVTHNNNTTIVHYHDNSVKNTQVNNNNNNNNTVNIFDQGPNQDNVSKAEAVEKVLDSKCSLTPKKTENVALFKDLFDDEGIENKEHLLAFIEEFQTTVDDILLAKESKDTDNVENIVTDILYGLNSASVNIGKIYDKNTLLVHLAEPLWLAYILPPLHSNILEKVVKRSVRTHKSETSKCEVRELETRDAIDKKRIAFAAFLSKYKFVPPKPTTVPVLGQDLSDDDEEQCNDDNPISMSSRQKFELHCRKYAMWTKDDMYDFIRKTMRRICVIVDETVYEHEYMFPSHIKNVIVGRDDDDEHDVDYDKAKLPLHIPMTSVKRLEKQLIDDSRNAYVDGWRTIEDALDKPVPTKARQPPREKKWLENYKKKEKYLAQMKTLISK